MRGKEVQGLLQDLVGGITPACARKRSQGFAVRLSTRDHPRVCGEKISQTRRNLPLGGSPPRVRGKARGASLLCQHLRITPACAGKRKPPPDRHKNWGDHPRVCGEKPQWAPITLLMLGSPPRMRGKGQGQGDGCDHQGITPACAGKSSLRWAAIQTHGDHPRVCGEKMFGKNSNIQDVGSSPRMRGKVPSSI